jgi:adenylate kinase
LILNLIMLGPPGAGKGTQAERLARTRGIPKISTGDILREAVTAGTEIGIRAKAIMDRGELVSDDVMIGIVKERIERADALDGFVLDGFPRTVAQASALDRIMDDRDPLIIIDVVVPERELIRRLASRLICQNCGADAGIDDASSTGVDKVAAAGGAAEAAEAEEAVAVRTGNRTKRGCHRCGGRLVQRSDDNVEVVRERLKVYKQQSKPLVEYYKVRPTFRSIDGAQSPDRVARALRDAIDEVGNGLLRSGARS